ncbi:hypothetical protein [Nocardia sp. NPDC003963]
MKGSTAMVEQQPPGGLSARSRTASLVTPESLYRAIAGHLVDDLPVTGWARELGDLHAELMPVRFHGASRRDGFDGELVRTEIRRVTAAIDAWRVTGVPTTSRGRMHTHSLGEVISHNAELYAEASWWIRHSIDARIRHAAWFRLAEAREGYREMVDETHRGLLRFPSGVT